VYIGTAEEVEGLLPTESLPSQILRRCGDINFTQNIRHWYTLLELAPALLDKFLFRDLP
jgi:hypothetical protein